MITTYLFATTFQESLIEAKLIKIDVFEHVIDLVIRLAEWFRNVDTHQLFQEYEYDHPICFATSIKIVLIKWGNSQELKHLVFVNILTHVADDMCFQVFHLQQSLIKWWYV